jgi:hypothetical protein
MQMNARDCVLEHDKKIDLNSMQMNALTFCQNDADAN